jgi:hypothetical protein
MAEKYLALAEESVWRTAGSPLNYLKLLTESINTTREDFYPETTQYWTVGKRAEGPKRTSGSFDTLVDPIVWPELLVYFLGDASSAGAGPDYTHTFWFGDQESVYGADVKPVTTFIGVGIEKDRQIEGCLIESINLEAVAREVVSSTVNIIGSGDESLITAKNPDWSAYTEPYLTFASATTMTVGAVDRLTTNPQIEAFRLNLSRGWDADFYVLGSNYLADAALSGMATVTGSMDFNFWSEDEHERFLSGVGASAMGTQASFETIIDLQGATLGGSNYGIEITIPTMHYTASTASVNARDRIIQTVEFIGMHDGTNGACKFVVTNDDATMT